MADVQDGCKKKKAEDEEPEEKDGCKKKKAVEDGCKKKSERLVPKKKI